MSARSARRGMLVAALTLCGVAWSAPARADVVTEWNAIATDALIRDGQGAVALAHLAMIHGAVYDAVNAIDRRYQPYLRSPRAKRWYSKDAAAATAAYRVLVDSRPPVVAAAAQPGLAAALKPIYDASIAAIPPGRARDGGVAVGNATAGAMIRARTDDGRFSTYRFPVGTLPGEWRPPLPPFTNDPGAWLKDVKPFLLRDLSAIWYRGPNPITSRAYAREFAEVKAIGSAGSTTRTSDQTEAARFWGAANAVGTWSSLLRSIAGQRLRSTADSARMFAMVYLTAADAAITVWIGKARYLYWRPITAIREAASDDNPATEAEDGWLPLIANPPYPDHPSGLSALGASAAGALQDFFGTDRLAFGTTNTAGVTRGYTRFSQARDEIVDARVWSGIHFRISDEEGARIGDTVSGYRDRHYFRAIRHGHDVDRW